MLGSSSTVYNEQPTSADSCLLGHALKLGTRQIYNNLTKIQHISVSVGLIPTHVPTHAGKTVITAEGEEVSEAHPRGCGERNYERQTVTSHAWLTPAHTGNTRIPCTVGHSMSAHPHAYGENFGDWFTDMANKGSSPRIRGKQVGRGHLAGKRGLIPTHAGKTTPSGG